MTSNIYSTMSIVLGVILIAILLETLRVVMRSVRRKLFLGKANLKADILPVSVEAERRQHQKVNIKWPVTLTVDGKHLDAMAKDISLGGAFIACENPLPLQECFSMAINVPGERTVALNGQVVWSNSNVPEAKIVNRGMGIKFSQNTREDILWLKNLIANCLRKTEKEQWVANETKAIQKAGSTVMTNPTAAGGLVVPARA